MEKEPKLKDPKECCSTRDVLWYVVFAGFAVNYMVRIHLNIAIVSMVNDRPKDNISLTSECLTGEFLLENATTPSSITLASTKLVSNINTTQHIENWTEHVTISSFLKNEVLSSTASPAKHSSKKFDWNEKQQGMVLGSFFWLHWLTQIPGGMLAGRYGTKLIFGLSNFSGVVISFFIPFCASKGTGFLIFARTFQGLLAGFSWPAMHSLTARWIPPNERSKFVTAYLGSSVGAALTYPICGFIIDRWGWEVVFYVCGVVGTVWFLAWGILVYDSPAEHPRISKAEREYINACLGQSVGKAKEQPPIPWLKILTNTTALMNIVAQFGGVWGLFTLMTHAPTYFKFIHGWNIKATGLLSGLPHLLRMFFAYTCSLLGDYLLRSNKMSRSNVRKLATAACCILQGVFMLALSFSGCDRHTAIVFLALAVAMHGAVSTGPLASIVDISPNYASIILGCCNTIVAMTGFLTPVVVGHLTYQNQTVGQWQKVFWVAAALLFISGTMFCLFAKSELQPWNTPEKKNGLAETELMVVKSKYEEKVPDEKHKYEKVSLVYGDVREK